METKPALRHKAKNKKSTTTKQKTPKKRKTSDGKIIEIYSL